MPEQKLVYVNADGVRRTLHWEDEHPNFFRTNTEIDVTDLVKNNAELAELHPRRSTNKLMARIPMTIYEKSVHEEWDEGDWKKWLNSDEAKPYRIWQGRA